jgi:hypothetical protein
VRDVPLALQRAKPNGKKGSQMTRLPLAGQTILGELIKHMATGRVVPGRPETYIGYKSIHDALDLPYRGETYGESLKNQGLEDLAMWTHEERRPAVTGLIVDQSTMMPGPGYFELFRKEEDDFAWWTAEIARSLEYDWRRFVELEQPLPRTSPPETPQASDVPAPDRVATTIYRVLRDTELARRVKQLNRFECQICGHTIMLPDGSRYAEAHHIQPLGQPHNGPDIIGNILCVCPNHHAELDYGVSPFALTSIRQCDGHAIEQRYVDYHNGVIHRRRL